MVRFIRDGRLAEVADCFYFWLGAQLRLGWDDDSVFARPRLFAVSCISLTTWLRHPGWALDSYRRHVYALRRYEGVLRRQPSVAAQSF